MRKRDSCDIVHGLTAPVTTHEKMGCSPLLGPGCDETEGDHFAGCSRRHDDAAIAIVEDYICTLRDSEAGS